MMTAKEISKVCIGMNLIPSKVSEPCDLEDGYVDFGSWHIQVGFCEASIVEEEGGSFLFHNFINRVTVTTVKQMVMDFIK